MAALAAIRIGDLMRELPTGNDDDQGSARAGAVVVYAREGPMALALARTNSDEFSALKDRLRIKGYVIVTRVSVEALRAWAADDTPDEALRLAAKILRAQVPK